MGAAEQAPLAAESRWEVHVSKHWDVLGPFPIHAREQHFLSPSFPIDVSKPIDYKKTWPSSLADGGMVSWTTAEASTDGHLEVTFPEIRWNALRATEGWAALQHHTVLRTTLTVYPPASESSETEGPKLAIKLLQGSFFTILPAEGEATATPEWHYGNIYALGRDPPQVVTFSTPPSTSSPTTYNVFVSGDYEIRLFGDPAAYHSDVPVLSVDFNIEIDHPGGEIIRVPSQDITCDFVDGMAFGSALGIGFRSASDWWTVNEVQLLTSTDVLQLSLVHDVMLAPTQTRVLPLQLLQSGPFKGSEIGITIRFKTGKKTTTLTLEIPVKQYPLWTSDKFQPIKASYLYMNSTPTAFLVVPPKGPESGDPHPPILALHGAGVDIFKFPSWSEAVPRQNSSWIILPTGRTSWGLDWHGPSAQDAWQSVDALGAILKGHTPWHLWRLPDDARVILVGHSNGGQGTWYMASRYPDRVIAAVPASGYIKSQSYVPLTQSRSAHFIDPALRAILETSLTPDDNDLFLSNLVNTPVLAVHGGLDENVPVWHSREYIGILKSWNPTVNVSLKEDPGMPHYYPSVLASDQVQAFLDHATQNHTISTTETYTLTVSVPSESGTFHGWSVESLHTPGRLGRLVVSQRDNFTEVRTVNIRTFSIHSRNLPTGDLVINGIAVSIATSAKEAGSVRLRFSVDRPGQVYVDVASIGVDNVQPSGRMSTALSSKGPVLIVISDTRETRSLSVALRLAHVLNLYHKLDAEIITDAHLMRLVQEDQVGGGTLVVIGNTSGNFTTWCLGRGETPFAIQGTALALQGRSLGGDSVGAIFLHPHPTRSDDNVVFMLADDPMTLERVVKLFPVRTGVTVPDWLVISGSSIDQRGAAGVKGAGLWGPGWTWNEGMSWLD